MNHKINQVLTAVLVVVALLTGQSAWAESSWTVTNSNGNSNTFTIKRSEKGYEQTVHFRTISLSAYAGQHFTAVDMDYTFLDNEDEKTVTVTEMNPSTNAYKYQTGASRKYGFEVIDRAGFRLAYAERSKTWGTSVTSSGVFDIKDVTIQTSEYTANDDGYDANGYKSVDADKYCTSGTQAYLGFLNAQLRMTLSFDAKENDDAYEYLQLLFDNTSTCDNRSNCSNGDPGNISLSSYMAGFEMNTGAKDDTYRTYTFPVTSVGNNEGATDPWGYDPTNHKWPLKKQKFKSDSRASDGRIIVPMNFSSIVLRLNASGSSGSDEWAVKNVKAHIQAIDGTNPTKIAVSVNPGRHAKGNTVYVSVAFSEIVTVTGTPTLTTTSENHWGSLTYVDGSGTNVLTFSTTIPQNATGNLNITGLSGTVTDLAGNSLSGGVTASSVCTLDDDFAYTINDFQQEGGNYLIKTHEDLIGLAGYVNGGGATKDKTFLQVADIAFAHTTNWNSSASTENNYTAIGYYKASNDQKNFEGTYDGGGHTISGIRIYRNNNTDSDNYQGLFGHVKSNGAIRNVNLSDTRITGRSTVGGIVGYNMGTVEDCTVAANVCIHQIYGGSIHGGVVGYNLGSVKRCISSAHLTVKNGISTSGYGGIVGRNEKSITDCIATDVVIPDVNARGAIVGVLYHNGTLTRNYYHGCKVASDNVTPSGVGQGTADSKTTSDVDGTRALYAITLGTNVTLVRNGTDLPGTNNRTYDNGADINGQPYAYATATVTLGYSGEVGTGYHVEYSTTAGSIDGSTLTMPAEAVTVSATIPANSYTVHFDANATNGITATGTMNNQAFTYDADQTLTANAFTREGYTFAGWNTQADGQGTSYTNQQVTPNVTGDNNATVTLYAQWNVINWTGNGTQGSPYLILYPSQLVKLAEDSQSNNYNNKYFQLHDDLNMSGVTIGRIGNNNNCFKGTFDGDGHAIRNLTINKPDNTQVGLFSTIYSSCTIKNLIIDGASITGKNFVGALVGYFLFGGTIENCLVVNSSVTVTNPEGTRGGAISGEWSNSATLSGNYYLDCSVTLDNNAVNATNIGTGYGDKAGARSVHMLTLPEHVTVSGGETVTYNTVTYYASNVSVTLSAEANFALANVEVNGTPATDNGDGTWSFTMPAEDVTVTAAFKVPYIAADGTTQSHVCTPIVSGINSYGKSTNDEGWYVVNSDVTISGTQGVKFLDQQVNIILCDGTTLTSNATTTGYDGIEVKNGSLAIYGQSLGTGSIVATASNYPAISSKNSINLNGGNVSGITNSGIAGISNDSSGSITIRRGNVTATGSTFGIRDLGESSGIVILGGTVNATAHSTSGIGLYSAYRDISILGGNVTATVIKAGGYYATGTITLGYTTPADRITASSYACATLTIADGQILSDGTDTYSGTLNSDEISAIAGQTIQPAVALAMNSAGIMTYTSPYALDLSNVNAYVVSSYSNTNSTLTLTKVTEAPANTGLLLKAKSNEQKGTTVALPLKASAEAIASNMLVGVLSSETVVPRTDGDYTNFILANGTYGIDWYTLSEDGVIGANKAYLQLLTADLTNLAREFTWVYEGETTGIEPPTISPEGESTEAWYDLNGRKLNGKPTTKGLYIHNGRKVVVK